MSCNSFKKNFDFPAAIQKCLDSPRSAVEPISPPPLITDTAPADMSVSAGFVSRTNSCISNDNEIRSGRALSTSIAINGSSDHHTFKNESNTDVKSNASPDDSQSPMNVLATIALAISPTFALQCGSFDSSYSSSKRLPSKGVSQRSMYKLYCKSYNVDGQTSERARSELLFPLPFANDTSYSLNGHSSSEAQARKYLHLKDVKTKKRQGSDIQQMRCLPNENACGKQISDAELLLDFSRGTKRPISGGTDHEALLNHSGFNDLTLPTQNKTNMRKSKASIVQEGHFANSENSLLLRGDNGALSYAENVVGKRARINNNDGLVSSFSTAKPACISLDGTNTLEKGPKLEQPAVRKRQCLGRGSSLKIERKLREISTSCFRERNAKNADPCALEQALSELKFLYPLNQNLDIFASSSLIVARSSKGTRGKRAGSAPATTPYYLIPSSKARAKSTPPRIFRPFEQTITQSTAAHEAPKKISKRSVATSKCSGCNLLSKSSTHAHDKWICCNGCKGWYHYNCAGFRSEREVRSIHKFYCENCKPEFGASTFVRKSGRAHRAVDYAGLNEGVIRTSEESPEHPYIRHIKSNKFKSEPDKFPRIRPELITAEFFEKCGGLSEPVIIPAGWNQCTLEDRLPHDNAGSSRWPLDGDSDVESVTNDGQDRLDMVIPHRLTVRQVAKLYGPEEKVEVIDVKSQEGEDKRWNMRRWADYYEEADEKVIRNVISLEVSASKLGRLIRRPRLVRELDLQDDVWPKEETSKGFYPKVQLYCLMSVADCYTDFHIDFGGSSVYYHILKGKKTFFFIPPTKQNLKKYEGWCLSESQNWTFLPEMTNGCYRVDLTEGDTMIIPSGWIHAVWTPENSLVIGGNFLTRMHFEMQIRIADIEKNTKVPRKFRYPFFQKIMWYTAIRYLEDDPLPSSVYDRLRNGESYKRARPLYEEVGKYGHNSANGTDKYNSRYYSRAELDGLPELARYLFRTVMISIGSIEGITADVRNAVTRSIPKSFGEPLVLIKTFAMWIAWKRGNEEIPKWAYPEFGTSTATSTLYGKKLSVAALKRLENQPHQTSFRKGGNCAQIEVGSMRRAPSAKRLDKASTKPQTIRSSQHFPTTCRQIGASCASIDPHSACIFNCTTYDHDHKDSDYKANEIMSNTDELLMVPIPNMVKEVDASSQDWDSYENGILVDENTLSLSQSLLTDDAVSAEPNFVNGLPAQLCES